MEAEETNSWRSLFELSPIMVPYFLSFFVFRGFFSNFPLYLQLKNGLTDVQTVEIWGIISGISLAIGAVTRIPAGILSDKIGRLPAISLGYLIYLSSLVTIFLFNNLFIYVLTMGSIRFGASMFAMSGRAIVSRSKRDRGLKNGLLSSMVGLGSFFGPFSTAYVLEQFPPDAIILFSLVVLVLDGILFALVLAFVRSFENIDLDLNPSSSEVLVPIRPILSRDGVWEIFFLFLSAGLIYGFITSVYTIYGFNILEIELGLLGFVTGAGPFVQVIVAPLTGILYKYVRDEIMRSISWGLLLVASVFMVLSDVGIFFFIVGYFLLNLGNASYFTMEITRLTNLIKQNEFSLAFGMATSLIILATAISGFLSPLFYNIDTEGTYYAALVMSSISFILVVFTTRKWASRRRLTGQSY